jgi:predicted enzyme related to lactoylglutathione lyase
MVILKRWLRFRRRTLETLASVFREKCSIALYGFISLIIDTEGNMIGLQSTKS